MISNCQTPSSHSHLSISDWAHLLQPGDMKINLKPGRIFPKKTSHWTDHFDSSSSARNLVLSEHIFAPHDIMIMISFLLFFGPILVKWFERSLQCTGDEDQRPMSSIMETPADPTGLPTILIVQFECYQLKSKCENVTKRCQGSIFRILAKSWHAFDLESQKQPLHW